MINNNLIHKNELLKIAAKPTQWIDAQIYPRGSRSSSKPKVPFPFTSNLLKRAIASSIDMLANGLNGRAQMALQSLDIQIVTTLASLFGHRAFSSDLDQHQSPNTG